MQVLTSVLVYCKQWSQTRIKDISSPSFDYFCRDPSWAIIAITLSQLQPYSIPTPLESWVSRPLKHSCFLCSCSQVKERGLSLPQTTHVEPAKSASWLTTEAVELHLGFIDCFMQEGQVLGESQSK